MNIPQTMRAAVLFGHRDLRIVQKAVPAPGPGEVLVKVACCAICGTDLHMVDHPFPSQPPYGEFTPGHEYAGTVVALGQPWMNSRWETGWPSRFTKAVAGATIASRGCTRPV